MEKQKEQKNVNVKKRRGWLAAVTGLLFVAICVTGALLASILKQHVTDDMDAIALVPSYENTSEGSGVYLLENGTDSNIVKVGNAPVRTNGSNQTQNEESPSEQQKSTASSQTAATAQTSTEMVEEEVIIHKNPGFQVSDNVKVWETNTEVDIFKIAYENGEAVVTVDGMDDKVIAPGTGNEYIFYLKNTGDVLLDYTLEIEAYFTPEATPIPVEARLKGYDGSYLLGSDDAWGDVLELNQVKDEASIAVNRYAYYSLEWRWPFESGDDSYDTFLGNMAVDEDLTLTIAIKTVATGEDMVTEYTKVPIVSTGDDSKLLLWAGVAAAAVLGILIWIIYKKHHEKDDIHEEN